MKAKRTALIIVLLMAIMGLQRTNVRAAGPCVHPAGSGGCFTTIQAAVDAAADGDRISIRSGTYAEQISIYGKNLTLAGQSGAVIQAPAGMQDTLSAVGGAEGRPVILVVEADVTVRNLTIDGLNSAEANPFLDGIVYVNAGGVIRDNLIKNMGFGTPTMPFIEGYPTYQGNGIVIGNLGATPRTITIEDNKIVNFNSNGITVFANADFNNPAAATLTAHVLDNKIIAQGANDVIDQWGIFLGGYDFAEPQYSVTGTIKGNEIRDELTVSPYPVPGIGIFTFYTYNVEVAHNEIKDTNVGFAANLAFNSLIKDNRISGPQSVPGSSGLILSGSDIAVQDNQFKKLDLGIMLMVDNPMFGSAQNTSMHENRFENVGLDMLTSAGPSAEATMSALSTERVESQPRPTFGPR